MPEAKSPDTAERGEAERALQWQSVAMLASMDGMAILDPDGRYLSLNPAHARIYGYDAAEDLVGKPWMSLYSDVELRRMEVEVMPFLNRSGRWRGEATGRRRDGSTFPQELSLSTLPDGGLVCVVRDITERRNAEEELRTSEVRFRTVVEALGEGIVINDLEDRVVYCNSRLTEMTGYSMEEMLRHRVGEYSPPEERERLREIKALRMRGIASEYEIPIRHRDGTTFLARVRGSPFRTPAGTIVGTVAVVEDISERRRAEEDLRHSERLLAEAQRMARMGSWEVDLATGLGTWSEEAYRICGRDPADGPVSAEAFREMVHPDDREWLDANTARAFASGRQEDGEFRVVLPSGETRYLWSSIQVEFDASGAPRRMFGHRQDITEKKLTELDLRRAKDTAEAANRAKSDFLSSMSHELRTPLNSVIGFASVLRKNKRGVLDENELKYLDRIHANGRHLLGLINDVLDLSKIEAGKMEIELRPVSIDELVAETLGELAGAVRDRSVGLRSIVPAQVAPLETDRGKLKQVLINLVGNAIKFTETGSVTVALVEDPATGSPLRLEVRDTGSGIDPERLATIFGAFEQAEGGIARRYGGTGLGLTISRSLCELMGHRLEVVSEPGAGSTFTIVFGGSGAEAGASAAGEPEAMDAEAAGGPLQVVPGERLVLVIDDETDARTLLTHHLEELGCHTISARSGPQGIRMAREFRPDLITLDLLLPGMDGWEILRALKADPELQDIPVVIVSVIAGENRARVLGAVDLIEKPIEQERLRNVLDRHLAPGTGRVLVVDGDPEARARLTRCLREEGIEARSAGSGGEALGLLGESPVDLIVLDLPCGGPEAIDLLRRLRDSSAHRHVPIVVVTAHSLSRSEARQMGRLAAAVLPRDESLETTIGETIRQAWRSRLVPTGPQPRATARPAA